MRSISLARLLLLLAMLSGCGSQSSGNEIAHELQTVKSWVATAHMVGDAWLEGAVPTPYAKQTLQTARQELHKEADKLAKKASIQQGQKSIEHLEKIEQMVAQMSIGVEEKDRTAVSQQIHQLSMEERAISTLASSAGDQI